MVHGDRQSTIYYIYKAPFLIIALSCYNIMYIVVVLSQNLLGLWGGGGGGEAFRHYYVHSSQLCKEGKWEYIARQRLVVAWPHPLFAETTPCE